MDRQTQGLTESLPVLFLCRDGKIMLLQDIPIRIALLEIIRW